MTACPICDSAVHEIGRYDKRRCVNCGALDESDEYNEVHTLKDVLVKIRVVGEDYDDHREPEWDDEWEVVIYTGDYNVIGHGSVHRADHEFSFREQDEVVVFGAGMYKSLYGDMFCHANYVELTFNDDWPTPSIELKDYQ